jgi:D-3-phosphoglycerate dehydrogenase / 2-oxoglutarate reductase
MTQVTFSTLVCEPDGFSPLALQELERMGTVRIGPLDRASLLNEVADVDALVVRLAHHIDEEVLASAARLRFIVSPTTGLDHIDRSAAENLGITIISLLGDDDFLRSVPATAEHTWALLLSLTRRVPFAHRSVMDGDWDRDSYRGHDLAGRRLCIIGCGRVGERVARYGQAFDMAVGAFDPYRTRVWPGGVERFDSLNEALAWADVVTLHVPLTPATTGLMDAAGFARMRPDALLVNTSRGAVIDEQALLTCLAAGSLGGAALDVVSGEVGGHPPSPPLLAYAREHGNLIITPHIGGATVESMHRTEERVVDVLSTRVGR